MSNHVQFDSSDYATIGLNIPTIVAFVADVAIHSGAQYATLEQFTEWYTKGIGAIVVTVNAYLLWKKVQKPQKESSHEE